MARILVHHPQQRSLWVDPLRVPAAGFYKENKHGGVKADAILLSDVGFSSCLDDVALFELLGIEFNLSANFLLDFIILTSAITRLDLELFKLASFVDIKS